MTATLTPKIAHAVGWDAGNRHMREAGRTVWNEDDYNVAARTTNQLAALGGWLPAEATTTNPRTLLCGCTTAGDACETHAEAR